VPAGTVRTEGEQIGGFQQRVFNAITPETEGSSFYFWSVSHPTTENADEVTDRLYKDTEITFEEDRIVIENQYARLQESRGMRLIDLRIDAGALHARRIIKLRVEREKPAAEAVPAA
jgi:hypothetical protein